MTEGETEEREFQRLWGPWDDLTPARATELLEGFARPWWISGGWAIEAFTGVARPHKDVDVTVFRRDVQELRRHFHGRYDLWSAGSATLRPLDDAHPLPRWSGQVWVRAHALAPWILDVVLNPGGPRWVFKRDRSITFPLGDATWVAADGLRYLRPELVLAHKLRRTRMVDDRDLGSTLPLLDAEAVAFLLDLVERSDPTHHWRALLEDASRRRKSVRAGDPRHERSSVARP
jgi:hypothetical protein